MRRAGPFAKNRAILDADGDGRDDIVLNENTPRRALVWLEAPEGRGTSSILAWTGPTCMPPADSAAAEFWWCIGARRFASTRSLIMPRTAGPSARFTRSTRRPITTAWGSPMWTKMAVPIFSAAITGSAHPRPSTCRGACLLDRPPRTDRFAARNAGRAFSVIRETSRSDTTVDWTEHGRTAGNRSSARFHVADFDGDARLDFAVGESGGPGRPIVLRHRGGGRFSPHLIAAGVAAERVHAVDGHADRWPGLITIGKDTISRWTNETQRQGTPP